MLAAFHALLRAHLLPAHLEGSKLQVLFLSALTLAPALPVVFCSWGLLQGGHEGSSSRA